MGYWKCKRCGNEIVIEIPVWENFDFTIDKNGAPDEPYSLYGTIDEHVKQEYESIYKCPHCDEESEDIEEIAYWED